MLLMVLCCADCYGVNVIYIILFMRIFNYILFSFLICVRGFGQIFFFFSRGRRHTRFALVTGVQTCALPISGYSTGEAMAEMEKLVAQLPAGFAVEWTGLSYQEIQAGNQTMVLMGLAILIIFMVLAALYESWAIPLSVMLAVPLGMLGTVAMTTMMGMSNDVYFLVGMITVIGLAAKNAILIVEFAKDLYAEGKVSLIDATVEAARLRFRPILMTSFAFILGVEIGRAHV